MWKPFDSGDTRGSEDGTIILDEEHSLGARITLERDTASAPFAITCGVYGLMVHTRFFSNESYARAAFESMKDALAHLLESTQLEDDSGKISKAVNDFVEQYP